MAQTRPKSIPKPIRRAVIRRDGWACRYCGARVFKHNEGGRRHWYWRLTIDHVVACWHGGPTTVSNCVVACYGCNVKKDRDLPEDHWSPQPPPAEPLAYILYADLYPDN